jgi:hypothetical protein
MTANKAVATVTSFFIRLPLRGGVEDSGGLQFRMFLNFMQIHRLSKALS